MSSTEESSKQQEAKEEEAVDLSALIQQVPQQGWDPVQTQLDQEGQLSFSITDDFEFLEQVVTKKDAIPVATFRKLMKHVCHSTSREQAQKRQVLLRLCLSFTKAGYNLEHLQVALEEDPFCDESHYYSSNKECRRWECNQTAMMLLLHDNNIHNWGRNDNDDSVNELPLWGILLLAKHFPSLLLLPTDGRHEIWRLPMDAIPHLIEELCCKEDPTSPDLASDKDDDDDDEKSEAAIAHYVEDLLYPLHEIWCDELGVSDDAESRFVRLLVDLVQGEATKLLQVICKKKLWLVGRDSSKVWKAILRSDYLCKSRKMVVLESVQWALPNTVTPELVEYAKERNRSSDVLDFLIRMSNETEGTEASAASIENEGEASKKRTREELSDV